MTTEWRRPRQLAAYERKNAEDRKRELIAAGMALAEEHGFDRVTRDMVAKATGVSVGLVSWYWNAIEYQTALMDEAVATGGLLIVAQGLAAKHPAALAAPFEMRAAAANLLVGERP